jgi:tetratricopeptide (TPR) repeat protein
VFILADHGEGLGSHGESFHGVLLYDATTHIPFLVRPPKGRAGSVVDYPVSLVDVVPTVLAAASLPEATGLDGKNLSPWILGDSASLVDRQVYAESLYAQRHYGWAPQRALIDASYKLIDSTTPELYARTDVQERDDLANRDSDRLNAMGMALGKLADAMTPEATTADRVEASADRMAQLAALGYVTGLSETDAGLKGAPDPVKQLPVLRQVEGAREALRDGDLALARTRLEEVLKADPGLVEPQVMLATLRLQQGDLEGALAVADALDAKQPLSHLKALRANIHVRMGDPEKAGNLFREALELDPYLSTAWVSYLHMLYMVGDLPRLHAEIERAIVNLPEAPGVLGIYGVLLVQRGEVATGRTALEQAIAGDPGLPWLNQALGQIERAGGHSDQAETLFLSEITLHPPAIQSRRFPTGAGDCP